MPGPSGPTAPIDRGAPLSRAIDSAPAPPSPRLRVALAAPLTLTASTAAARRRRRLGFGATVTFGSPLHKVGGDTISNWGGYVAHGATFTIGQGLLERSPRSRCLTSHDLYAPWVGIDGDGTSTVEQTGVADRLLLRPARRTRPGTRCSRPPPFYYADPISIGDKFTASVTANGTNFTLKITDNTKGWTESGDQERSPSAQKATAEAVIEAPGGYPDITTQKFIDVVFNGKPLDSFSEPGASTTPRAGAARSTAPPRSSTRRTSR